MQIFEQDNFYKNLIENEKRANIAQRLSQLGYWDYNLETHMFWGSKGAFNIFGINYTEQLISIDRIMKHIHIEDRFKIKENLRYLINKNQSFDIEFRIMRKDNGQTRYMHAVAEMIYNENKKPIKAIGALQDITERIQYEKKLLNTNEELTTLYEEIFARDEEVKIQLEETERHKELLKLSESRYKTLVNNSQDSIYSCDINGMFNEVNEKFCKNIGIEREKIIGKRLNEFFPLDEDIYKYFQDHFFSVINNKRSVNFEYQVLKNNEDIFFYITLSPIFDAKDDVIGITGTNHNITSLKKSDEKIKHMAFYDPLTDLPNRSLFFDRLKNAIERSKRFKTKIAVLFFDMDNFKRINDTLGHSIGDEVLVEAANRIKSCMREYDTIARLSGDEFAALLQGIEKTEDMLSIIERIKDRFNSPFYLSDNVIDLTTSIGISMYPEDGDTPEELLKNADTAMYKAKEEGRNKYIFFQLTMKEEIIYKMKIEKLLKKAIDNHEFELYYQPQYISKDRRLRGFEALIRWNSPELDQTYPSEFISIAEETGLILEVGEWVIKEACRMINRINEKYKAQLIISINISLLQLRQRDFDQLILKYIHYYNINPNNIELEITESLFIDNYDIALVSLKKLKKAGVRIALDDFGTGYSSLSYLKKLPINLLKIDQTFVKEIDLKNIHKDLTAPIISLVHKLGIQTIAEGVETLEQLNYLVDAGCDHLQGFYLGKPMSQYMAEELINKEVNLN